MFWGHTLNVAFFIRHTCVAYNIIKFSSIGVVVRLCTPSHSLVPPTRLFLSCNQSLSSWSSSVSASWSTPLPPPPPLYSSSFPVAFMIWPSSHVEVVWWIWSLVLTSNRFHVHIPETLTASTIDKNAKRDRSSFLEASDVQRASRWTEAVSKRVRDALQR